MTREQLVAAIKQNICGKVHRELVSLEVFPMKNYGALETGVHRFSHPGIDNDQADAKFVLLWKYEGGRAVVVNSGDELRPQRTGERKTVTRVGVSYPSLSQTARDGWGNPAIV